MVDALPVGGHRSLDGLALPLGELLSAAPLLFSPLLLAQLGNVAHADVAEDGSGEGEQGQGERSRRLGSDGYQPLMERL